ncbi:response regulator [Paenibacillus filicis]|uniref:Response regulator n=1 Tax=Paenibacillus filicis TaxID=669464 RepID=A0ABU9DF10_9BACL
MFTLIVIEDEYWTRELIKQFVYDTKLDIQVVGEEENGEDGFRLIDKHKPDIVITDMQMPQMNGVELLKLLEQYHPEIKLIVLSGHDDFIYTKQAIRSGAIEYLLKPLDRESLKQALLACLVRITKERAGRAASSLIMLPSDILNIVVQHKRSISIYVNVGNIEAIRQLFAECFEQLNTRIEAYSYQWWRIYQEFLKELEEFLSLSDIDMKEVFAELPFLQGEQAKLTTGPQVHGELIALYEQAIAHMEALRKARKKIDLKEIQQYIVVHYREPISLEMLATKFHVSKEYLCKAYKTQIGETMMDNITRLRMEAAKEAILEGRLPIHSIAASVGYNDASYFHKVFKKYYGMSPLALRET